MSEQIEIESVEGWVEDDLVIIVLNSSKGRYELAVELHELDSLGFDFIPEWC